MSRSKLSNQKAHVLSLLPLAAALMVAGCGGGGGGAISADSSSTGASSSATAAPVVFSGVAATGAALGGASVRVFGASGDQVCDTTATDAGSYSCTLAADAKGPFTIEARGGEHVLYSSAATAASATVNVTPLTNLIVSRLSPSGDPAKLMDAIKADPGVVTQALLDSRVAEIAALLAPLTAAVGDKLNPISGTFAADGKGHDKVLDSLQISIRPDASAASIQITIKVTPASDSSAPLQIAFLSDQATPAAPAVTIRPEDLVQDGISTMVSSFLARVRACYALPLAQRMPSVPSGVTSITGDWTRVQASECRSIFVDDDPALYKHNGLRVGSSAALAGMYLESSTGTVFDAGNFEYRLANGDVFVTFRGTSVTGAVSNYAWVLRAQNGQLKAVGNQYAYEANVTPYAADREFPLQPQFNSFATGYVIGVRNRVDPATGNPLFAKAIVTSPTGSVFTLMPTAGSNNMFLVRPDGTSIGSDVQWLTAAYKEAGTAGNPSEKGTGGNYSSPQRTDEELRAIADQGVWTVEWVHADSSLANVTQSHRTLSRARTLGEIRQMKFAQFTPALRASWLMGEEVKDFHGVKVDTLGPGLSAYLDISAADGGDGWTVPDGALAPLLVKAYGSTPAGTSFDDQARVASTARRARIECSAQSSADVHCDTSTGVPQFALASRIWNWLLYSETLRQGALGKSVSFYRLPD